MGTGPSSTGRGGARPAPARRASRLASAGVIREAATTLFLRSGYLGTSMDEIAALAGVSKQTLYTHFANKEQLFSELARGTTDVADESIAAMTVLLQDTDDLERALRELGRRY